MYCKKVICADQGEMPICCVLKVKLGGERQVVPTDGRTIPSPSSLQSDATSSGHLHISSIHQTFVPIYSLSARFVHRLAFNRDWYHSLPHQAQIIMQKHAARQFVTAQIYTNEHKNGLKAQHKQHKVAFAASYDQPTFLEGFVSIRSLFTTPNPCLAQP